MKKFQKCPMMHGNTRVAKLERRLVVLLEDNQLHLVRKKVTTKDMWNELKHYYKKSTLSNKVNCGLLSK